MVGSTLGNLMILLRTPRLVISSFEGRPKTFLVLALIRAILRKRVAIIFLRAHLQANHSSWNYVRHRVAMRLLTNSSMIKPISIVRDFQLAQLYPSIAYIPDPEFWDLDKETIETSHSQLAKEIEAKKAGRRVMLVAGGLAASKGLSFLSSLVASEPALVQSILIVLAGQIYPDAQDEVERLEKLGALKVARHLGDEEFLSLFKVADFAWACYAPNRDMSSGILGRCLQIGVTPVIRRGAVIANMIPEMASVIELDYEDLEGSCRALLEHNQKQFVPVARQSEYRMLFRAELHSFFEQAALR